MEMVSCADMAQQHQDRGKSGVTGIFYPLPYDIHDTECVISVESVDH